MYSDFAYVYDALMRDVNYQSWADYYAALLERNGVVHGASCVECACGTGSLTIPLYEKGYRITGVDLSDEMLSVAMRKARARGCGIPFIRQDMSRLALGKHVDAILATCDGVNYLHPEKAQRFFDLAYAQMKHGAVLIFDVSSPWKLRNILGSHTLTLCEEAYSYIWENQWNDQDCSVRLHVTAFVKQKNDLYARVVETQLQYAHDRVFLEQSLSKAGFRSICFYGNQTLSEPGITDERWHITARKL